jgi:hypothetical protein
MPLHVGSSQCLCLSIHRPTVTPLRFAIPQRFFAQLCNSTALRHISSHYHCSVRLCFAIPKPCYTFPAQYDSLLFRHSAFPQHFVTTQNSATTLLVITNAIQAPAYAIQITAFTAGTKLSHYCCSPCFSLAGRFCSIPMRSLSSQCLCRSWLTFSATKLCISFSWRTSAKTWRIISEAIRT